MKLLQNTMIINAASCIGFGFLFLIAGSSVDIFIGNTVNWLTPVVGAVLILNGCHLLFASKRQTPLCPEVLYFIAGDMAWVICSVALVSFGVIVTTTHGIVISLLVAFMVGTFGVLQFFGYKLACVNKNA